MWEGGGRGETSVPGPGRRELAGHEWPGDISPATEGDNDTGRD